MEANIDVTGAGGASPLPTRLPNLTFKRIFDAPIALVFKAWTDPLHVAAWWGPHGFSNPFAAIEPHPGGRDLTAGPDRPAWPADHSRWTG